MLQRKRKQAERGTKTERRCKERIIESKFMSQRQNENAGREGLLCPPQD